MKLFGVDLAEEIGKAFNGQLTPAVLTVVTLTTRTPGSLTAGVNTTTEDHNCDAIMEVEKARRTDQTAAETRSTVLIIANTLPAGVIPKVNDQITMESVTVVLTELLERDPAAAAYKFMVS